VLASAVFRYVLCSVCLFSLVFGMVKVLIIVVGGLVAESKTTTASADCSVGHCDAPRGELRERANVSGERDGWGRGSGKGEGAMDGGWLLCLATLGHVFANTSSSKWRY
jgi:hypothetical protein